MVWNGTGWSFWLPWKMTSLAMPSWSMSRRRACGIVMSGRPLVTPGRELVVIARVVLDVAALGAAGVREVRVERGQQFRWAERAQVLDEPRADVRVGGDDDQRVSHARKCPTAGPRPRA